MPQFNGVALVTGAASGIGAAVALGLAQAGCTRLILVDDDASSGDLETVKQECLAAAASDKAEVVPLTCGMAEDEHALDSAIEDSRKRLGDDGIRYFANCAGSMPGFRQTTDLSYDEFKRAVEGNQKGTWVSMRAELRHLVNHSKSQSASKTISGSIVNVASHQGLGSEPGFATYAASSHGIVGMTRTSAMDYLKHGVRINCVCPAPTESKALEASNSKEEYARNVPLQKINTAQQVAAAVVFLLSDDASAITGVSLPVDSGWSLCHY